MLTADESEISKTVTLRTEKVRVTGLLLRNDWSLEVKGQGEYHLVTIEVCTVELSLR